MHKKKSNKWTLVGTGLALIAIGFVGASFFWYLTTPTKTTAPTTTETTQIESVKTEMTDSEKEITELEEPIVNNDGFPTTNGTEQNVTIPEPEELRNNMNLEEVIQNNLISINGLWQNSAGDKLFIEAQSMTAQLEIDGNWANVNLSVSTASDGNVYLGATPEGGGVGGFAIGLFPVGTNIPVFVEGQTDFSGVQDLTDKTRDRLTSGQSAYDPEMTAIRVFYRVPWR